MDAVVKFMHEFTEAETEAARAQYTEHDEAVFERKLNHLKTFYGPDLAPDINKPNRNAAFFAEHEPAVGNLKPRIVFQIKRYEHPKLGDLYRCYVSNYIALGPKALYFANLYVTGKGKDHQIIANYGVCRACGSLGEVDGKKCPECKGKGWIWVRGAEINNPGKLVDVRKLHKPDRPQHLAEYEAE